MAECRHEEFFVDAKVGRLTEGAEGPVTGYTTDITVKCSQCGMPFRWIGPEAGSSPRKPMVSFDGYELRAPIAPGPAPWAAGPQTNDGDDHGS